MDWTRRDPVTEIDGMLTRLRTARINCCRELQDAEAHVVHDDGPEWEWLVLDCRCCLRDLNREIDAVLDDRATYLPHRKPV